MLLEGNARAACAVSIHTCNYFAWCGRRGNGLERQCVRGEAWTVHLLNLSWGLWERWNENSGLLLLRRCFIENMPTCHPRESKGGEECGHSLNRSVHVCVCVCRVCAAGCKHVCHCLSARASLGYRIENESVPFFQLIIHCDIYRNCHFWHLRCLCQ